MKTLYLLEMGMNDNAISTDIKNHRVRVLENIDIEYKGTKYNMFFEFLQATHYNYRKTNKRTGEPLKKMVQELIVKDGLSLDTQFEREEHDERFDRTWTSSWCKADLEKEFWDMHLEFTRANVLKVVNAYSLEKYDKVVLVHEETARIINSIGGFREKDIIKKRDFQTEGDFYFEVKEWNNERKIVRVNRREWEKIDSTSRRTVVTSFIDVDILNKRIVG